MATQLAEENDLKLVDEVRNFLFGPPGAGGLDLWALDIQRGRDHGLPSYNSTLISYLGQAARRRHVSQITSDPQLQQALTELYRIDEDAANIDNIDLFVGALAEDHVAGSLGLAMADVIGNQFARLRNGDRFFYLGPDAGLYDKVGTQYVLRPDVEQIIDLDNVTLGQIIRWNTGIHSLPADVFFAGPIIAIVPGDFDGDGQRSATDIDLLSQRIRTHGSAEGFDLNDDHLLDEKDRVIWVKQLKQTYFGDANLDQQFDSDDLITVLAFGEYEDPLPHNSSWATGDWNGDGDFDSSDLVTALQDGGYDAGAPNAAAAVPEPTACVLQSVGTLALLAMTPACRRRSLKRRPAG
jgi:hypothetical protein